MKQTVKDSYYRFKSYDSLVKGAFCVFALGILLPFYRIFNTLEWLWYSQTVIGATLVLVLVFLPLLLMLSIMQWVQRNRLSQSSVTINHKTIIDEKIHVQHKKLSFWNWDSLFVRSKPYVILSREGKPPIIMMKSTWGQIAPILHSGKRRHTDA